MNVESRIRKLTGHSENLLTFYLGTVRKYSVLDPMLFSSEVCDNYGSHTASHGYQIIRESLYYGVVQDIATMFFDNGRTNPSILNIRSMLDHEPVKQILKEKCLSAHIIPDDDTCMPWHETQRERSAIMFDTNHKELFKQIEIIENDRQLKSCKDIRDKFTAHIDLQYSEGEYRYPDISKYGLQWNTPRRLLNELKPIIIRIGQVVRNAGFDWEGFDSQNNIIASGMWKI